jgi:DNA-directed RNA polymerase specialized sigma24 family protein
MAQWRPGRQKQGSTYEQKQVRAPADSRATIGDTFPGWPLPANLIPRYCARYRLLACDRAALGRRVNLRPRDIAETIRLELKTFADIGIPERKAGKKWQKLDCPYCHSPRSASISYQVDYFRCWNPGCGKIRSTEPDGGDWKYVQQFIPLIRPAIEKIERLHSHARYWDLDGHLRQRLLVYAGEPDPKDADAGALEVWEERCSGDPAKLDSYVQQALNGDALDYMRKTLRREHQSLDAMYEAMEENSAATSIESWTGEERVVNLSHVDRRRLMEVGIPPEDIDLADYPTLTLIHVWGYNQSEVAVLLGVSVSTVKRRIDSEGKALAKSELLDPPPDEELMPA